MMCAKKAENKHIYHRQRLKERLLAEGVQGFDDKTLLELLLTFALPRVDTRPLAAELLDRFGTLARIFDSSVDQLTEVNGIKTHTAVLLTIMPELSRRFMTGEMAGSMSFLDEKVAAEYLKGCFAGYKETNY